MSVREMIEYKVYLRNGEILIFEEKADARRYSQVYNEFEKGLKNYMYFGVGSKNYATILKSEIVSIESTTKVINTV